MELSPIVKAKEELLELMIKNAYFREKVILSSGKESDYYIDARLVTLMPKGVSLIAQIMLDMIKDDDVSAIGGPTLGADPMIGALGVLSLQQGRPLKNFIIRKAPKGHGKQNMIEGPKLTPDDKVVIIDDVATTGKAFVHSLDVLHSLGIKAVKAICIVDRDEGAKEAVAAKGCQLESIFHVSEIHK